MILKRLILQGFKSFADRTEFEFDRGITGIVGPNGCGKSNIVDAIKWVLGSQSPKSLRGNQMLDVVFNGSGTRKPSGMAQIDLVFDNHDRRLPTDQAEVTISRQLYRSGESEYLLNKQPCRLRDIRELFLDTGIGVDAYSVIEQGRVDSLLRANPEDRRQIFEEAAGISKYKFRKREAQRRLERVNQNLLRLQDIIDELERRLRSIKVQAGKARSYHAYTQRLRELKSTFALAEFHRLSTSAAELERVVTEHTDRAVALRTQMAEHEAAISRINVEIVDREREISQLDAQVFDVQSQITAHEERLSSGGQRVAEQMELLERNQARASALEQQLVGQRARLDEQTTAAAEVETALQRQQDQLGSLQAEDHRLATELNDLIRSLEDAKAAVVEALRRASQISNEIHALRAQRDGLQQQRTRLESRESQLAAQLADLAGRRQELEARRAEVVAQQADLNRRLDETRRQGVSVAAERAQLLDELAGAKEHRSALESRRQVLDELDRRREGLQNAVRELLAQRDADAAGGAFGYVRGPLGELLEADSTHALLVEAALGAFEGYLVVSRRAALLADGEAVAALGGRVHAFCLDHVPPLIAGPDLIDQPGVIGPLLDHVRYPEDCDRLVRHLLGRTYLVDSLETAVRLTDAFPAAARYVTGEGCVIEVDGRVAVGPMARAAGIISRRSELRELNAELAAAATRIDELVGRLSRTETQASHLDAVQQELRSALIDVSGARAETDARLASLGDETVKLEGERPLIAGELRTLCEETDRLATCEKQAEATLGGLESERQAAEQRVTQTQARVGQATAERYRLGEQLTQARVRVGELIQQRASRADAIQQCRAAVLAGESELAAARREVADTQERLAQLQRQIAESRESLTRLSVRRQEVGRQVAEQRERREKARCDVEERGAEHRRLRQVLDETDSALRGHEVQLSEVRVRLDDLCRRVRDEMSVELAELYRGEQPTEQDLSAVEAEIGDLKGKIERLGNVNLDAITEQEDLEKRHEFLARQRDDLRTSERQLLELIEKLNAESIERFNRTFADVREHFSGLFKKLFGGGKADIFLIDPNDPLETGIEIVVRPPGKELQTMTLLSGGEKTMTAIALLLAVFKTHPSPFALLDEVDAALDEANNTRFNHVLQEFVEGTQFLIITHSKRTMSIADVLYGITMQEAGVSKRISVRFENETAAQSAVA